MNYTIEDLAKIKQLLSSDVNNVKVGLTIAKSFGISDDILIGLFGIEDIIHNKHLGYNDYEINAFGDRWVSMIDSEHVYRYYSEDVRKILQELSK